MGERQKNRFLVFPSVGDQNQVSRWIHKDRGYDVAIAYYGDSEFAFRDSVEYFIRSKDVKIPNFLKCVWGFEDLLNYGLRRRKAWTVGHVYVAGLTRHMMS